MKKGDLNIFFTQFLIMVNLKIFNLIQTSWLVVFLPLVLSSAIVVFYVFVLKGEIDRD